MALTPEQIKELKAQLSEQIKDLPDQQRQAAQMQIDSMSDEAIEEMLNQQQSQQGNQKIFRSVVSGEIPSKQVDSNKDCIAVLDIKPISKGHIVIIPKKEVQKSNDFPDSAFKLAKKLSDKIVKKLKAEGTEIQTQFSFGELVLNVIPVYDKPVSLGSQRTNPSDEELNEVLKLLKTPKKKEVIKLTKKPTKKKDIIKLNRRVP